MFVFEDNDDAYNMNTTTHTNYDNVTASHNVTVFSERNVWTSNNLANIITTKL